MVNRNGLGGLTLGKVLLIMAIALMPKYQDTTTNAKETASSSILYEFRSYVAPSQAIKTDTDSSWAYDLNIGEVLMTRGAGVTLGAWKSHYQ
jgi:hypothetical protein